MMTKLELKEPRYAILEEIQYIHSKEYIEKARKYSELEMRLDPDTVLCKDSYDVALLAAGGAITAVDAVLDKWDSAFALVRPPGHHATPTKRDGILHIQQHRDRGAPCTENGEKARPDS